MARAPCLWQDSWGSLYMSRSPRSHETQDCFRRSRLVMVTFLEFWPLGDSETCYLCDVSSWCHCCCGASCLNWPELAQPGQARERKMWMQDACTNIPDSGLLHTFSVVHPHKGLAVRSRAQWDPMTKDLQHSAPSMVNLILIERRPQIFI